MYFQLEILFVSIMSFKFLECFLKDFICFLERERTVKEREGKLMYERTMDQLPLARPHVRG